MSEFDAEAVPAQGPERYYEALGLAVDSLLRRVDCQRLVTTAELRVHGRCRCGTRRFKDITALSVWEWLRIRCGLIRFPYREQFLEEFSRG